MRFEGPALVLEATGTWAVDAGFVVTIDEDGSMWLCDEAGSMAHREADPDDPVRIEVFQHLFMSIAQQMGETLRRTAMSTNIRERLDFSCAVFDGEGRLVANAPHIPVHLGAMGETVRAVKAAFPAPSPGDAFVANDPAAGGSHLPDITVVTPVHVEGRVRFFVASRGHHADVGGVVPGSMPPSSTRLEEEGILLPPAPLVISGELEEVALRERLASGTFPARRIDENIADLAAQAAANMRGLELLGELCATHGADAVSALMGSVQKTSARCVADAISRLGLGTRSFRDALDDGSVIAVHIDVDRAGRLRIDFTGSAPPHPRNLNAPRAVVKAAVMYVLRALVEADIPLNDGFLQDVEIRVDHPSILSPPHGAAIVAGNVETSQRIVDVLLGALGLAAASQGTMNNFAFGNERLAFYETLAGGAGAGPGFRGAPGVHTHMTNTRVTDAEVLEARYPVRVRVFGLRRGSGGRGRWPGGDGVVREVEFLEPMHVSIVSQRRVRAPFGLAGGEDGARGRNFVAGREVGGNFEGRVPALFRVRIETPGGGGYGSIEGC
jgi:5-oxoprolinase (ATP-hydrolysing)